MQRIVIYDCTLRDGSQGEDVVFSAEDKLLVAQRLDEMRFDYIEGGFPGAAKKDAELFRRARELDLKHAKLAAFSSTRRPRQKPDQAAGLRAALESGAPVATIFGKSSVLHVDKVLRTSKAENLRMIEDSCALAREHGLETIYDAEHFFDGYKLDAAYALKTLAAAVDGGAEVLVLCDTNGGSLPWEIADIVDVVRERFDVPLGIHTHNDAGLGVATSLTAVKHGCVHVQGTVNGYGERCGNADLCSIIPDLELKMGKRTIGKRKLRKLRELSRYVSELANLPHPKNLPYVGESAFAHKGGMHIDAVRKEPSSIEHVDPERVGNSRRLLISELAGRSSMLDRMSKYRDELVDLENRGYQYEGAEASFDLLMRKAFGLRQELFHRCGFRIMSERREDGSILSEATIKVRLGDREVHTAAEGRGPVSAIDNALRKALLEFHPEIKDISLADYKVRVIDSSGGTGSDVRVLIESTDGRQQWGTVGVSHNIIEASYIALLDAIEYGLLLSKQKSSKRRKRDSEAR
ncbi:MAG: citramalate synthase [Planctomycetota bacterium]